MPLRETTNQELSGFQIFLGQNGAKNSLLLEVTGTQLQKLLESTQQPILTGKNITTQQHSNCCLKNFHYVTIGNIVVKVMVTLFSTVMVNYLPE
jgi:hypothetical protein